MSSNPAVTIGVNAVDKASAVLEGVDQKVKESAQTVEQAGSQMQNSSNNTADAMTDSSTKVISRWQQMKDSAKENASDMLKATFGLTAGIASFATSFGKLNDVQIRADQANLTYSKSLERLDDVQNNSKASAQDLANAQETVRLNLEKVNKTQGDVTEAYTNFLAQVPAQMLSFGTASIGIMNMLGASVSVTAIKYAIFGGTKTAADGAMITSSGLLGAAHAAAMTVYAAGTNVATAAMHAFRIASIMAFITNPVGIAILAISTLVGMLIFNIGGLRDMFVSTGEAILGFLLNHFRPLIEAVQFAVGWFGSLIGVTGESADANKAYGDSASDAADEVARAAAHLQAYEDWLKETAEAASKANRENLFYLQSVDALSAGVAYSSEELQLAADYLKDVAKRANDAAKENFDLVASTASLQLALDLNNEQVAMLADSIQDYNDVQADATKAAEDEAEAHRKATDEIRDRVEANIALAKSMGVHIDASKTTVGETERISDHLKRLTRDYENNRQEVEEFAIAYGVDVVDAVRMTDDELVNTIKTLGGFSSKNAETRKSLISDFEASRQAVADFATQTNTSTELASSYWSDATDSMISDNKRAIRSLDDLIEKYEDVARAARRADNDGGSNRTVAVTSGGVHSGNSRTSRLSVIPNAEGGEGWVNEPTLFLAGEAGPEYYTFTPGSRRRLAQAGRDMPFVFSPNMQFTLIQNKDGTFDIEVEVDGKRRRTLKATRQKLVTGPSR